MKKKLYILSVIASLLIISVVINIIIQERRIETGIDTLDTKYESIEDISKLRIKKHLEIVSSTFFGNYSEFSESDMLTIGMLEMKGNENLEWDDIVLNKKQLNAFINYYFGLNGQKFKVQEKEYNFIGYDSMKVNMINEDEVKIDIAATEVDWNKRNVFKSIDRVGNDKIIANYSYQEWVLAGTAMEGYFEDRGETEIHLVLEDGYLVLEKIVFSKLD